MSGKLPEPPDFKALQVAAATTADKRTTLMALIGNLAFSWSNNESMFIYLIMLLLDTDETAAAVVFSTLNTTRARLDLIRRLALLRIGDKAIASELDQLITRFDASTRLRNQFNHAVFDVDAKGDITHTRSLRLVEKRGKLKFGETQVVNDKRLKDLSSAIAELGSLNRDIWDFLPRLQNHLRDTFTPPG
jgi:hypothetical protein